MAWKKFGNCVLLLISYGLYIKWEPVYALILLWVTAITYATARLFNSRTFVNDSSRKLLFIVGILLTVATLCLFKYYHFVTLTISELLSEFGFTIGLPGLNWALPLGLSFFTIQAIGYLADVYLKRIEVECNWWDYMLFVAFFPQIASGPISKAKDLLPQIKAERPFNYNQAVQGLRWILWGMFIKVVMADRVGIYVDTIFNNYEYLSGLSCLIGSFLYTLQIYGDFAGYSFMAVGVAELLGFELINNFHRPYSAQSITVFTASPMYGAPSDKDYKVLKDLCVKYDVPFINHYADARLCNNSDFFADVAHLNQGGAEKFTSMITSEIKGVLKK